MKNILFKLSPPFFILTALLCTGCRSANWYLSKAVSKGLRVDTTSRIIHDSVLVGLNTLDESFDQVPEIDTVYVKELCREAAKNVINRKLSRAVCPQVDNTYYVDIEVQGSTYKLPIKLLLADGRYRLQTGTLKIPFISKAETNLNFTPPDTGFGWKTVLLAAFGGLIVGGGLAFWGAVKIKS